MKSEDLLKAIGNIDDKFIEEAAPKINAVNETNTAESNDSAKTDDKKLVEIVKVKPRNTFRIVASIAACVCLVAAVSFAIIGSTKSRPQTSDDGSLANKIESSINNMESSDKKTMENSNITSSVSSDISDETELVIFEFSIVFLSDDSILLIDDSILLANEPSSLVCGLDFVEPIIAKLTAATRHTHAAIDATILNVFLGLTLTISTSFLSSVFALSFDSAVLVSLTAFILGAASSINLSSILPMAFNKSSLFINHTFFL